MVGGIESHTELAPGRSYTQMNNSLVIQKSKLSPNFALYAKNNTMSENKKKIE